MTRKELQRLDELLEMLKEEVPPTSDAWFDICEILALVADRKGVYE
jgi:hypothetical protein